MWIPLASMWYPRNLTDDSMNWHFPLEAKPMHFQLIEHFFWTIQVAALITGTNVYIINVTNHASIPCNTVPISFWNMAGAEDDRSFPIILVHMIYNSLPFHSIEVPSNGTLHCQMHWVLFVEFWSDIRFQMESGSVRFYDPRPSSKRALCWSRTEWRVFDQMACIWEIRLQSSWRYFSQFRPSKFGLLPSTTTKINFTSWSTYWTRTCRLLMIWIGSPVHVFRTRSDL